MDKKTSAGLTADQAHAQLGGNAIISRAGFYSAIKRNEVPHLRLGRRIIIPRAAFEEWLTTVTPMKRGSQAAAGT